jgi:hypothetical protein
VPYCIQAQPQALPWWKQAVVPMVGPFNKDSGPTGISTDQILQDFQPEVAEWSCLPLLKDHPLVPRAIRGGLEYQEFPQSPVHDLKLWLDKFGVSYEPTEANGVALPSGGKISDFKYGSENANSLHYMCHNAPRWHEFHRDSILRAALDPAVSLVRQDNIGGPSGLGSDNGGWCACCLAGFKARLQGLPAERLKAMGITDLAALDPRAYLQAALKQPPAARLEDPVVREYVRFLLASNLNLWKDEVAASHAARPEVPICGNQGSTGPQPYPYVLLSDAGDLIFLENSNRAFTRNPNSLWYALNLAGGRHGKPAWIWDFGSAEFMAQVAGSQVFVAECYVNGAVPYYELNNLACDAQKGYHSIPMSVPTYTALATYARFARQHRDLLTGNYAAATPVALLYSVPSFAPRYCGAVALGNNVPTTQAASNHFSGLARALEAAHIPYNVEVLGDQELWPDPDLEARLARYRLLLCPDLQALSEPQLESLRSFQASGGRLLISGGFANRDEGFNPRPQPAGADLEASPRTVRLTDEPLQFLNANAVSESRGASQTVQLNQTVAKPLVIRGWSKAEEVSGPSDNEYSLWVDLTYDDGSPLWAQVAPFKAGTHGWQESEFTLYPAKPVTAATVHAIFRYHSGKAWFDDVFFGEVGSDRNLLQNPGFEAADAAQASAWKASLGWQQTAAGYTPDPATAHSGTRSILSAIPKPSAESPVKRELLKRLEQALLGVSRLETNAPAPTQLRPYLHGKQTLIQLLNLDIDADRDEMRPVGPFWVKVPLPPGTSALDGEVVLHPADGDQAEVKLAAVVKDGRVEFQVPGLRIWSLVTFTAK